MSNHTRVVLAAAMAVALVAALAVSTAFAERPASYDGPGIPWQEANPAQVMMTGTVPFGPGLMAYGEMGFDTPPAFGPWADPSADEGWGDAGERNDSAPPAAPVAGTAPFFPHGWDRMWGWGSPTNPNGPTGRTAQVVSIDQAIAAVQRYVQAYNNPDLMLAEVKEFSNNFSAVVEEKSSGNGAFELLVERYTGDVRPEPGPNATWNTKYGYTGMALAPALPSEPEGSPRSGARAGRGLEWSQQLGAVTVTLEQARAGAQRYLDAKLPGAKLVYDGTSFPGYYTFNFLQAGKVSGTVSVNGYTGQVWYHGWHGEFVREREL